jgi:4-hydroxy-tetrahydrodipicolinate synthase
MKRKELRGMGVALITPFNIDGSVDYATLDRLVDYQIENNTDFLCVLGTTAETPTLSADEQFKVRQGASWDVNFGVEFNGANIVVEADGQYRVQLVWDGAENGTVTLVPAN